MNIDTNHTVFKELQNRFSEASIVEHNETKLVYIPRTRDRNYHIISTIGMSDYSMPVPETFSDKSKIELFFVLPDYWKPDDLESQNHKWVWDQITFMSSFPKERETWFGPGHTIPYSKDGSPISEKYEQVAFLMAEPYVLEEEMKPMLTESDSITFLAVIPLFKNELDFKNKSGTHLLLRKFLKKGISEKVDMFRQCGVRKKWLF